MWYHLSTEKGDAIWQGTTQMSERWFATNEPVPVTRGEETLFRNTLMPSQQHWCAASESWQANAQRAQIILRLIHMYVCMMTVKGLLILLYVYLVFNVWAEGRPTPQQREKLSVNKEIKIAWYLPIWGSKSSTIVSSLLDSSKKIIIHWELDKKGQRGWGEFCNEFCNEFCTF